MELHRVTGCLRTIPASWLIYGDTFSRGSTWLVLHKRQNSPVKEPQVVKVLNANNYKLKIVSFGLI